MCKISNITITMCIYITLQDWYFTALINRIFFQKQKMYDTDFFYICFLNIGDTDNILFTNSYADIFFAMHVRIILYFLPAEMEHIILNECSYICTARRYKTFLFFNTSYYYYLNENVIYKTEKYNIL